MNTNKVGINNITLGCIYISIAIALSSVGAHALDRILPLRELDAFKTATHYQILHAFALIIIGILQLQIKQAKSLSNVAIMFQIAMLFFCGGCYLFALTSSTTIAYAVPIGGFLFIFTWIFMAVKCFKLKNAIGDQTGSEN